MFFVVETVQNYAEHRHRCNYYWTKF